MTTSSNKTPCVQRVLVLGPDSAEILPAVKEAGLSVVTEDPEAIITYGGDGLLLGSERDWPGIPKLPLRKSRRGKKCEPSRAALVLEKLACGELARTKCSKIRAEALGQSRVSLNDIMVHNANPTSGVRYRVWVDDREFGDEIVGDGVVVATPFGSSGYYRSITGGIFRIGLGLAFNNSTEQMDHIVLPESSVIRVRITRGPAMVASDNHPNTIPLERDDEVVIRRDQGHTIILGLAH